ncbi:MAG: PEP-CTERM sorting domain-containing protein [Syntrophobacteraceae bacterium]
MKQMRAALILVLILIFSSPGQGFGVPIESVPEPDIHGSYQIASSIAPTPPLAKIPDSPVEMFIRQGSDSRFELFFIDVRYGYDLVDFEFYKAWCLAKGKPLRRNAIHKVRLYNCYDPYIPPEFSGMGWSRINYVVNHKKGSKEDIQQAIWHFTTGEKPTPSVEATQLIKEANLKGKDYIPAEGELIAIICQLDGRKQPVFIEYKIPESIPLDVSAASFDSPMTVAAAGSFFPAWLPFLPLIPVIPFIPTGPNQPPDSPPPSPPTTVPEPSSLLLLASGMAGILISRTAGKRIKKPYR